MLCLLTFRPEFAPPWTHSSPVLELDLGPLTSENVRALAAWASVEPLDPAVLEWVDTTADGVPLFVEETLKMLEHADQLRPGNGRESLTHVPSTLQGLLTERLDRLPALGGVVDVAAVLGREFDRDLLVALWPSDGPELEPAMAQLAVQDVLRPVPGERARCEFSHALLQEAAYDRILRRRRQALHGSGRRRAHRALLHPGRARARDRRPPLGLCGRAREGGRATGTPPGCGRWSARPSWSPPSTSAAGWRRSTRPASTRPATWNASTCSPTVPRRCRPLTGTPRPASRTPTRPRAGSASAPAPRSGSSRSTAASGAFTCCAPSTARRWRWATRCWRSGEQAGDEVRLAEGHLYRGLVHMYLANFEVARGHSEQAFTRYHRSDQFVQIYEAQGDMGVGALAYLALVLWNLGYADESRDRSDLSLELADEVSGPVTKAQAWGMRSILHLARGEPVELRHWTEKTRAHSADLNIGYWHTVSLLHARLAAGARRASCARASPSWRSSSTPTWPPARGSACRTSTSCSPTCASPPVTSARHSRRCAPAARTSSTPVSASRSPSCFASWAGR